MELGSFIQTMWGLTQKEYSRKYPYSILTPWRLLEIPKWGVVPEREQGGGGGGKTKKNLLLGRGSMNIFFILFWLYHKAVA